MVNHCAGIFYKAVDSETYDVYLNFEGGVVMVCYEAECSELENEIFRDRIERLPFRTSTRTREWLDQHAEFWGATQTAHQPRI